MSARQRHLLGIAIGLCFLLAPAAARSASEDARGVAVRIEPDKLTIGNEFLVWEMKLHSGRMGTASVTNRRTGKVTTFQGEDFVLEFAGGRKIAASEFRIESVREQPFEGGKQLVLDFTHKDSTAQLTTTMKPGQWWARRWLTVRTGPGRLEGVTFARWDCQAARGHSAAGFPNGCGQPLYVDDLFLAIAHPGAAISRRQAAYRAGWRRTTRSSRMLPSNRGNSCSAPARPAPPAAASGGISTPRGRSPRT